MRMKKLLTAASLLLLFGGICIVENRAQEARPHVPQKNAESSIYMLAGEFRTVFANLLWLKADNYLHENLERGGDWAKDREMLGLLNLITNLDPQFEEAYACGTYIYLSGYNDKEKALRYLRQGLTNVPKSRQLNELMSVMYARHFDDPERALPYAQRAVEVAEDDWYRTHNTRRLKTIERMIEEKKEAAVKEQKQ